MPAKPLRIAFFGTPEFAVPSLQGLLGGSHEVVAVVTQPDRPAGRGRRLLVPPVKLAAEAAGLGVAQPERLKDMRAELEALAPDLAVVVAFGRIFRRWLLELPALGCINVHGSLLPALRGPAPVEWAVIRGHAETGVSVMRLARGVDTGPVCAIAETAIGPRETAAELRARLAKLGAAALVGAVDAMAAGTAVFEAQDDAAATHAPLLVKDDGLIDWAHSASRVDRLIRGLTPWPLARVARAQGPLAILEAEPAEGAGGEPGVVVEADARGPLVACGEGTLRLLRVRPAGRRDMDGASAVAGRHILVGQPICASP
jgi:methionyl-tRNA formyltransferase